MGVVIRQFEVYLVALDPTVGHEIQKTRSCLVVSPDEINRSIGTVIVAPMTKGQQSYPTRVQVKFKGQVGSVALDQIRAVDKSRLINLPMSHFPKVCRSGRQATLVRLSL